MHKRPWITHSHTFVRNRDWMCIKIHWPNKRPSRALAAAAVADVIVVDVVEHFIRLIVVLFEIYVRTIFSQPIKLSPHVRHVRFWIVDSVCPAPYILFRTRIGIDFILFMFLFGLRRKLHLLCNVCIFHGTWNSFLCSKHTEQRNNGYHIHSYMICKMCWLEQHTYTYTPTADTRCALFIIFVARTESSKERLTQSSWSLAYASELTCYAWC